VLRATAPFPCQVATYSEIAKRIGNPGRPARSAMPWPQSGCQIILPCHRIVPADRSIGNYTGGADIQGHPAFARRQSSATGTLVP